MIGPIFGSMTTLDTHRDATADRPRPLVAIAAAAIGLGAGVAFGAPFLSLVERAWTSFLLPAYLEILKSGIPFCG